MSDSIAPVQVDKDTWFYPEKNGMFVVHEFRDDAGKLLRCDQFLIPWSKINKPKSK